MNDDGIKRYVLLIAALASFLTPFMVSSINIALPAIGKEFHMSAVAMSWAATSYLTVLHDLSRSLPEDSGHSWQKEYFFLRHRKLSLTSVRTAFSIFAALCFAGVFASLARGKVR